MLRNALDLDEQSYLQIVQAKTAELCRVACSLAAAEGGADEVLIRRLSDFGDKLGIAFQIFDDYLDLWGHDHAAGKTLGTDLEQGKITLPLIRLLQTSPEDDRSAIMKILCDEPKLRVSRLHEHLERSDARAYTIATATGMIDEAKQALADLPASPAKECLMQIADFAAERRF